MDQYDPKNGLTRETGVKKFHKALEKDVKNKIFCFMSYCFQLFFFFFITMNNAFGNGFKVP